MRQLGGGGVKRGDSINVMGKEGAIYKFLFCDWLIVVRKTSTVQSKSKISRRLEKPANLTPTGHFIVGVEKSAWPPLAHLI